MGDRRLVRVGSRAWVRADEVRAVVPKGSGRGSTLRLEGGDLVYSDWDPDQVAETILNRSASDDVDAADPERTDAAGRVRIPPPVPARPVRILSDRVTGVMQGDGQEEYEIRVTEDELVALNRLLVDTGSDGDDLQALGVVLWPLYDHMSTAAGKIGLLDKVFKLPGYDIGEPRESDS